VEWQGRQRSATALASSPPRNATITGRRVDRSAALLRMARWPVGSGFLIWPAFRSGQTGECITTVMRIGIATKTADDTENAAIATIETGTTRTKAGTTGVTMKIARRRVKVCVQHENGDEYCRYRQGH
jgi:hypothetical protein